MSDVAAPKPKGKFGFASMDPSKRREIARLGGLAKRNGLRGFAADAELAKAAGRKGGLSRKTAR